MEPQTQVPTLQEQPTKQELFEAYAMLDIEKIGYEEGRASKTHDINEELGTTAKKLASVRKEIVEALDAEGMATQPEKVFLTLATKVKERDYLEEIIAEAKKLPEIKKLMNQRRVLSRAATVVENEIKPELRELLGLETIISPRFEISQVVANRLLYKK